MAAISAKTDRRGEASQASGAEVSRMVYLPYGELSQANSSGNDRVTSKFTGQEWDAETGLYYYGARYYHPAIGRFLSADSIVPSAADAQAFNRYAYARDNPVTYTDPTGHSFWSVIGGIFNSIFGAIFSVLAAIARAVTWAVNLYVDAVKFLIKGQIFALQIARGMLIAATRNPLAAFTIILAVAAGPPGWVGLAVSIAAQGMAMAAGIRDPQTLGLIGAVAGATTVAALLIGAAKYGAGQLAGEAVKGGGGPPWLAAVSSLAMSMAVNSATADPEPSTGSDAPQMSEEGIEFIKGREEFRSQMYLDEAGKPTIGYGHRLLPRETFTDGITEEEADALLRQDIDRIVSPSLAKIGVPLSQNQVDAVGSLIYNIGSKAFSSSTMLQLLNQGNYQDAADQFYRWIYAGGRVSAGLVIRRQAERDLYLGE